MTELEQTYERIAEQLDWRSPNGKVQNIVTLSREQAKALLDEKNNQTRG